MEGPQRRPGRLPATLGNRPLPATMRFVPRRLVIVPYDAGWPVTYEQECERALRAIGDRLLAIEHVGSTAVPGLAAKPSRAHPDVPRPVRGQRISAQVERTERGAWIAGLDVLDGGAVQFPRRTGGCRGPHSDPRTITRLAVLKAAAGFAASRPYVK